MNKSRSRKGEKHFSMEFLRLPLYLAMVSPLVTIAKAQDAPPETNFKCRSEGETCLALIDYTCSVSTTFGDIQTLFNVTHVRDIVGFNSLLPRSTSPNDSVVPKQVIRIPFNCRCQNGSGTSLNGPVYTIQKWDSLFQVAADVFSNIVTWHQIQVANNLTDPSQTFVGQRVRIPLPCSCDQVNGTRVLHYGHVVQSSSSLEQIANEYDTSPEIIMRLNGIANVDELKAAQMVDVPLKVCSSKLRNESLDYPLLVPNGAQIYTANGCVRCQCQYYMKNGMLQCEPSQLKPTNWSTCPSMQCEGASSSNLSIGNSTMANSCNVITSCDYAGYGYQSIFTTLATIEVDSICPESRRWIWLPIVGGVIALSIVCFLCHVIWRKCRIEVDRIMKRTLLIREIGGRTVASIVYDFAKWKGRHHMTDDGIQIFSFKSIATATNFFSPENKLGQGGFGPVYKGKFSDDQEITIKRLSKKSGQGLREFKNEAKLIAKLQHSSLVRLLGFCIEREERILVYEYMPKKSLDFYLFDSEKRKILNWEKRFDIIEGIAQGLVYLHAYSRLTVIHRDLKASNILLDNEMNPKISDFGMARIFKLQNGIEENTNRIVGTYGYMSPEYAINEIVSLKTDVFSFGVLVLEILTGKKNNSRYHSEQPLNLIGLAWKLWDEGRGIEIIDQSLFESCSIDDVLRCIQLGLLCVQDHVADRPSMLEVISMLSNENIFLPEPKRPAFYINEAADEPVFSSQKQKTCSINEVSISVLDAR